MMKYKNNLKPKTNFKLYFELYMKKHGTKKKSTTKKRVLKKKTLGMGKTISTVHS